MVKLRCGLLALCIFLSAGIIFLPKSGEAAPASGFSVRFFSDGTYLGAYDNSPNTVFHGSWDSSDGFFSLTPEFRLKSEKIEVGNCGFGADRTWTCTHPPRVVLDSAGRPFSGVGGSMFRGQNYDGAPGGKLKPAALVFIPQ